MSKKVATSHDSLFQLMMSHPKAARDFFDLHLPELIKEKIDWESLHQETQVYTDGVDKRIVDALYSAKIAGQEAYILLLTEHQSTSQRLMPLRLVEYMLRIVRDWFEKHGTQTKLPTFYPIIFYTGTKKYRHSTDFWMLFQNPTLMKQIFMNPFQLIELMEVPDEALKAHKASGLLPFIMKHRKDTDIVKSLSAVPELLKSASQDMEYLKTLMWYTLQQTDSEQAAELIHLFTEVVDAQSKEDIMTIADRLRQEGVEQGIHQGELAAKKTIAETLLKKGYGQDVVVELTGLSQEEIIELAKSVLH